MHFHKTPIPGAYLIDIAPYIDERGLFARTVCSEEFSHQGLNAAFIQQSISWNPRKGTMRGLHYQASPHEEEKLVRVTRGAIFDVIVDLRSNSPAYGKYFSTELSAENHKQLYIPKGVAHGFQTIDDDTEVLYEMTTPHFSHAANGIRWDDPMINIAWPYMELATTAGYISENDLSWPTLAKRGN
jgi:dTDP-4-dehydrorhamnose 3,5-epimerase